MRAWPIGRVGAAAHGCDLQLHRYSNCSVHQQQASLAAHCGGSLTAREGLIPGYFCLSAWHLSSPPAAISCLVELHPPSPNPAADTVCVPIPVFPKQCGSHGDVCCPDFTYEYVGLNDDKPMPPLCDHGSSCFYRVSIYFLAPFPFFALTCLHQQWQIQTAQA